VYNTLCNYSKEHSVQGCCMMQVITGSRSRIINSRQERQARLLTHVSHHQVKNNYKNLRCKLRSKFLHKIYFYKWLILLVTTSFIHSSTSFCHLCMESHAATGRFLRTTAPCDVINIILRSIAPCDAINVILPLRMYSIKLLTELQRNH
jgi:hypothetical protein